MVKLMQPEAIESKIVPNIASNLSLGIAYSRLHNWLLPE
jgi:hypothetical protein